MVYRQQRARRFAGYPQLICGAAFQTATSTTSVPPRAIGRSFPECAPPYSRQPVAPDIAQLRVAAADIKSTIFGHAEFTTFKNRQSPLSCSRNGSTANTSRLYAICQRRPSEGSWSRLLRKIYSPRSRRPSWLTPTCPYQRLMDYWADTMQDDCYLIAADGWKAGAQPREIRQVKNKENKLVWAEPHDFKKGKHRFKSDLIPAAILIDRYFPAERDAITTIEAELVAIEQQLDEKREEQSGEEGLLAEIIEGEGEKQKITGKAVKGRLREIAMDPDYGDERLALEEYAALLDQQAETKVRLKAVQEVLEAKLVAKYSTLTEDEIKSLVVDDKWLASIRVAVKGELDRVSHTLTSRVRQLAERYAASLPQLTDEVGKLASRVGEHLTEMGAVWK